MLGCLCNFKWHLMMNTFHFWSLHKTVLLLFLRFKCRSQISDQPVSLLPSPSLPWGRSTAWKYCMDSWNQGDVFTYLPFVFLFSYGLREDVHTSPTSQIKQKRMSTGNQQPQPEDSKSVQWSGTRHSFTWVWESLCTAASPHGWWQPQT